ncbi:MAG: hypothetical protein LBJ61_06760 [Deltaproteobacteria bacterium]|jgi:hypothetical protein|nr:hypothetical protein [Deltaproteobacteria bacterium]
MGVALSEEIVQALGDPQAVKVIGTVDESGAPRLAVKDSLRLNAEGLLEYDEIIETSETNKGLIRALWFGGSVTALILAANKRSYSINCRPLRTLIAGESYRARYRALRSSGLDTDLGAVWILEPLGFQETSLEKRRVEEEAKHPLLRHLDRLAVPPSRK